MKIIIADDNRTFREALVMFLETELHHTVIEVHENGFELLNSKLLIKADLLLLDIEMPVLNGIQTMKEIGKKYPWINAIAITDYYEIAYLKDLVLNGFKGCVFKDSIYAELELAIRTVGNGGIIFPKDISID